MKYYAIIKNGVVVDRIVASEPPTSLSYSYDSIVEDVNRHAYIGSAYNPQTGAFTMVGNPNPEPDEEQSEES